MMRASDALTCTEAAASIREKDGGFYIANASSCMFVTSAKSQCSM